MEQARLHYIVATGIIVKDGRYLIAKRSEKEKMMPGLWTVPGGKLEMKDYVDRPKDTDQLWYNVIEDLLRREVAEETGVEFENMRYLTNMVYFRPDGIPTVVFSFFADHKSGEVTLSPELTDHAWVTLEQAKEYPLIEGIYDELLMLDRHLNGKPLTSWRKMD
ncbi:MAG: NUDIX domain-containing protein [Candidatus Woesearchaeota archaeon]